VALGSHALPGIAQGSYISHTCKNRMIAYMQSSSASRGLVDGVITNVIIRIPAARLSVSWQQSSCRALSAGGARGYSGWGASSLHSCGHPLQKHGGSRGTEQAHAWPYQLLGWLVGLYMMWAHSQLSLLLRCSYGFVSQLAAGCGCALDEVLTSDAVWLCVWLAAAAMVVSAVTCWLCLFIRVWAVLQGASHSARSI
jgi:hypothetical protein